MGEVLAGVEKVGVVALLIGAGFMWNDIGDMEGELVKVNQNIIELHKQYGELTGKLDTLIQLNGSKPTQAAKP